MNELAGIVRTNYRKLEADLLRLKDEKAIADMAIYLYRPVPVDKGMNPDGALDFVGMEGITATGLLQLQITDSAAAFIKKYGDPIRREIIRRHREELAQAYTITPNAPANSELARQHMRLSPETMPNMAGERTIDLGHLKITQERARKGYELANITLLKTGITPQAQMLLDIMMAAMSETGGRIISFPIREYMESRGLKDQKEAKAQVDSIFRELSRYVYHEPLGPRPYLRISLHAGSEIRHGIGCFTFTDVFQEMVKDYPPLFLPKKAFLGDLRKSPNRYHIIRRIAEHIGRNLEKPNEKVISVAKLIEACPGIPTYEEVSRDEGKRFTQLIAEPFLRDLDAARDTYHITITAEKGRPAPEPRNGKAYTYEELIDLYVFADPIEPEHPSQTNYRKKRQLERSKAEAVKAIEA